MKHPIQPLALDSSGTLRFKENAIVTHLLDWASARGMDMNALARMDFAADERQHFAQLIGYSLDGWSTLSYVDSDTHQVVVAVANANGSLSEQQARLESLQAELDALRAALREPVARLYGLHLSDLGNTSAQ